MIRTILIEDFKSVSAMELNLGRVNCFIGANGVGKSNILEAIGILGAAANGRVDDEAIARRGVRPGLPRLYKSSFQVDRIRPHIKLTASWGHETSLAVSLLNPLERPQPAWSFKTETLTEGNTHWVSRGVRTDRSNLNEMAGLTALKFVELPRDSAAACLVRALQTYAIYCPNTPTLRAIAPDTQMRNPVGLSGGGLAEAVAELKRLDEDTFESVLDLIDWASDVSTTDSAGALMSDSVPRSKTVLKFTDRYMRKGRNTLTAYDASEGALYVLFTAALCLLPGAPQFFAIDNLDQTLNPRLVTRLTQRLMTWLRNSGTERQLLFTAHNPAVLDGLDLRDDDVRLFAVERDSDGRTCTRRIVMSDELAALNSTYPLSRLWQMGHLGAVPNV
jgi:predicted ATPase